MKHALISVYDKRGIVDFARGLKDLGYQLVSTGGTYQVLRDAGLDLKKVEDLTHFPEILDGRVKSLHPHIHAGILNDRDKASHQETLRDLDIASIDIVVNNLYPFEETVIHPEASHLDVMAQIDIGGPSMIRAAAKNYRHVLVVTDPADYPYLLEALQEDSLTDIDRQKLAAKAFSLTAYYDGLIARYFNQITQTKFPSHLTQPYRLVQSLRYGENPHQEAVYYASPLEADFDLEPLHGKQISYNNYNDLRANMELLAEFVRPACVAVKHANPCGVAIADSPAQAFEKAYAADDTSIYGGVLGFNRPVDGKTAELLLQIFIEIVVAPDFTEEALDILTQKKSLRLIRSQRLGQFPGKPMAFKETIGGLLVQDRDRNLFSQAGMTLMTDRKPSPREEDDLIFAWKVAKHCASNAMVVAKDGQTLGLGHGEVRRVWALESALERSVLDLEGAVVASDGFFFPDTIEMLDQYGIQAIVQPGGSIQDEKVIAAAKERDITVCFTGMRHFKH